MGLNWAEHTVEIAAPIETCFAAIIDYETFPSWQSAVVDTEILDWDGKGRGKRVRLVVDARIRKVEYTLDYRYDEPVRIEWDFVEGHGINDADGHYLFEDLGDRTRATYKFGLEVGIPLPGPVARRAHRSTLKTSVDDLKREAERRARGARGPSAGDDDPVPRVGEPEEWASPETGAQSIAELPAVIVGRTMTTSRRVAGGAIRTGRDVAEGVAGAGFGVARRTIGLGRGAAGLVRHRAARALGRGSDETDEYPR